MINDKEHEIMSILQEESAEVIQAISKIFRFGLASKHPDKDYTNREHLAEELGDMKAMLELCIQFGIVSNDEIEEAKQAKFKKLQKWSKIFNDASLV